MAKGLMGSCLCSEILYEIRGQLFSFVLCHCQTCRTATGTAFGASALVRKKDFALLKGKEFLKEYEHTKGKKRCFCRKCGSRVFTILEYRDDYLVINVGTIKGNPGIKPAGHQWVKQKTPWYEILDSLPQFDEGILDRANYGKGFPFNEIEGAGFRK